MNETGSLREQVERLFRASSGLVGESSKLLEQVVITIRRAHQFLSNGAPVAPTSPQPSETRSVSA
jgi:hypothetical protein